MAAACRWCLGMQGLRENPIGRDGWWFVKTDYVEDFFRHHAPDSPLVLVTHNSDYPIGQSMAGYLARPNLRLWFAANAILKHPKLIPIPLGIANAEFEHGDTTALDRVVSLGVQKSQLVEVSFSINTNPEERASCLDKTGLGIMERLAFPDYLARLAAAYFCISPVGNGPDCHRTWEALYMRTIPIVTRSPLTEAYPDIPWIVIEDWSEYSRLELSPDVYRRLWADWEPGRLSTPSVLDRMSAALTRSS